MSDAIDKTLATLMANLKAKTGKDVGEWAAVARASGLEKHGQIVAWLKTEHGLGHGYANMITAEALSRAMTGPKAGADEGVAAVFAGDKAALRPLYDQIEGYVKGLGADVEIAPKKANVSLRRSKQFALAQPSTKTRMDLGIQLKGVPPTGRLEASGSWNAMFTHRVRLESSDAFDDEVKDWLKAAYEAA